MKQESKEKISNYKLRNWDSPETKIISCRVVQMAIDVDVRWICHDSDGVTIMLRHAFTTRQVGDAIWVERVK